MPSGMLILGPGGCGVVIWSSGLAGRQVWAGLERDIILRRNFGSFHAAHHGTFARAFAARRQEANGTRGHFERSAGGTILLVPDARSACVFIGGETSFDENLG